MTVPDETPQMCKVFFLKPAAIPQALVIYKDDYILISDDEGVTWGTIPNNLVQGTIPIR